jgi:hypothetical protein
MFYFGQSSVIRKPIPDPVLWSMVTPGTLPTLVLDTLKTWIHRPLEDLFWDTEGLALIKVAQRAIERRCELVLPDSEWVATSPSFPVGLVRRPFQSVTKIEYVDPTTGAVTLLDPSLYLFAPDRQFTGQLLPAEDTAWPDVARRPDAVRITVKAGFVTLPDDIMHAIMMTTTGLDANRGDEGMGGGGALAGTVYGQTHTSGPSVIPAGAMALLSPYLYQNVWCT